MQVQNRERNRFAKIQAANKKNAQRIKSETCNFWITEYKKSRTSYNKTMMGSACNR